jgi:hypothetical protein
MSKVASLYFAVDAISCLTTGSVADHFIRRGRSTTFVRKTAMAVGHLTATIALIGLALAGPHHYMAWLFAVGAGSGMSAAGVFAFAQTLAGPETAGRWVALQNGFANFAGVLCATLTGFIVDKTSHFSGAFLITAGFMLIGGVAWVFVVGRLEQKLNAPAADPAIAQPELV